MDIKVGNKFQIKGISFDIEICGFFPASQNKENVDIFNATLNGESMKFKKSFIETLLLLNDKVREEKEEAEKEAIKEAKQEAKTETKTDKKVGKKK